MGGTVMSHGEAAHPFLLPASSLWLERPRILPECLPSSTSNAAGRWPQGCHGFGSLLRGYWVAGGGWRPGEAGPTVGPEVARSWPGPHSSTREGRNRMGLPGEAQGRTSGDWGTAICPFSQHLPPHRAHTWATFTRIQRAGVTPPPHPEPEAGRQEEDLRHSEEGTKGRGGPCSSVEAGLGD